MGLGSVWLRCLNWDLVLWFQRSHGQGWPVFSWSHRPGLPPAPCHTQHSSTLKQSRASGINQSTYHSIIHFLCTTRITASFQGQVVRLIIFCKSFAELYFIINIMQAITLPSIVWSWPMANGQKLMTKFSWPMTKGLAKSPWVTKGLAVGLLLSASWVSTANF